MKSTISNIETKTVAYSNAKKQYDVSKEILAVAIAEKLLPHFIGLDADMAITVIGRLGDKLESRNHTSSSSSINNE